MVTPFATQRCYGRSWAHRLFGDVRSRLGCSVGELLCLIADGAEQIINLLQAVSNCPNREVLRPELSLAHLLPAQWGADGSPWICSHTIWCHDALAHRILRVVAQHFSFACRQALVAGDRAWVTSFQLLDERAQPPPYLTGLFLVIEEERVIRL